MGELGKGGVSDVPALMRIDYCGNFANMVSLKIFSKENIEVPF